MGVMCPWWVEGGRCKVCETRFGFIVLIEAAADLCRWSVRGREGSWR